MESPNRSLVKRIAVAVTGGTITLIGIAMIVLPGPAIVLIPLGLTILATEFTWARRCLRKGRKAALRWKNRIKTRAMTRSATDATASRSTKGTAR